MPKPSAPPTNPTHFSDRLAAALDRIGSPVCIGLDPVLEKLPDPLRTRADDPAAAIGDFCLGVLDAVADVVPVVKFQSACFERYGGEGVTLLKSLMHAARERGLITILDAKRGDIGITADHYAAAIFDGEGSADAVTVSGYLGADSVLPLLRPGKGAFVLVRTSNPGSDAVQSAPLAAPDGSAKGRGGGTVATLIADMVAELGKPRTGARGLSDVGAVVGATKAADGELLRSHMPDQIFLVPGYGAQGGGLGDIKPLLRRPAAKPNSAGTLGVLVTASRSVIYAFEGQSGKWQTHITSAAKPMRDELSALTR